MTTILQSCLETQFIETTTLKLKVTTTKSSEFSTSNSSCKINNKAMAQNNNIGGNMSSNHDLSGWSFLQVLSTVSSTPKETILEKEENVHVHPLTKQYSSSSSRLSEKSLELCTESLGSETGSDIMDINILSLSSSNSPISENFRLKQEVRKLPQEVEYSSSKYKVNNSRKFPPPLTTISGSNSLQFRSHREYGRLVIQAVEAPIKRTYFQVERSNGRLRLSILNDHASMFESQLARKKENQVDYSEDDYELDMDGENDYQDGDYCQLEEDIDEEIEDMVTNMRRDMDDNIFDVDVEEGIENHQRLINRRCNERGHGNKGLCNWSEPLWVATS
ncbi:hypothetical protein ACH5RR_033343 [Cinchona calisaya]|uniref:FAF domain-containing protein n=1 Tax=Cinchona calisaya TaxID=153742 RepID=A0ABD2YM11_9GENT